jgi:hypothetical protein
MREIKFRAWDGEEFIFMEHGNGRGIWECGSFKRIEQYTGLKDKNGAEIYEGDICLWDDRITDYVEFKNNDGWKMRDLYNLEWWEDAVVIGNIHENPELLK